VCGEQPALVCSPASTVAGAPALWGKAVSASAHPPLHLNTLRFKQH